MKLPILGIDLGTTNTVMAVFSEGKARITPNSLGHLLTPSVVAYDQESGGLVVGRIAKEILAIQPECAASQFKRGMGTNTNYPILREEYNALELSAHLLRSLRHDAALHIGQPISRCIITVPAYFNEEQRFATLKAAELGGLEVERVLNEPTAAAIAYGLHEPGQNRTFLVFDLGGGTFNVCVMELFEGALEVKSTAGVSLLGGEDFTQSLVSIALEKVGLTIDRTVAADSQVMGLLYKRCELAKRTLSETDEVEVTLPKIRGLLEAPQSVRITRDEAERAFAPSIARLAAPCRTALRGARVSPSELDEIILVGGATRMPCIRRFVTEFFQTEPLARIDPDLIVATGAAVQAALYANDAAVADLVVTDVASHSLGVEITKEYGERQVPGYFSPVIHRNTVLPTSRTEYYHTLCDGQRSVDLRIFEGESRQVKDNHFLESLKVTGIPKGPAGQEFSVTFTYDLNGILEVEARIAATGKAVSRILSRKAATLSERDLKEARERLQRLKQDSRTVPKYRDLLLRADLICCDLAPSDRAVFELAIDQFEEALESHTPSLIEKAYGRLLELCEQRDGGEPW